MFGVVYMCRARIQNQELQRDSIVQQQISKDLPCMDFTAEGTLNKNPHVNCVFMGTATSNAFYLNISTERAPYKVWRIQRTSPPPTPPNTTQFEEEFEVGILRNMKYTYSLRNLIKRKCCNCLHEEDLNGGIGKASLILNLNARRRWEINFSPRPLYPRVRTTVSDE